MDDGDVYILYVTDPETLDNLYWVGDAQWSDKITEAKRYKFYVDAEFREADKYSPAGTSEILLYKNERIKYDQREQLHLEDSLEKLRKI